jgi:hypothetical protein
MMTIRDYLHEEKSTEVQRLLLYYLNRTDAKEQRFYERLSLDDKKKFHFTANIKVNSMISAIYHGIDLEKVTESSEFWRQIIENRKNVLDLHTKYRLFDWRPDDWVIPIDLDYSKTHFLAIDQDGIENTWRKDLIWDLTKGEDN